MRRARTGPRHGLEPDAARATAQPPQLALNPAAAGAEIEVTPALDAAIVDLQIPAGLAALGTHAPAPPQPNRHDHAPIGERDVRHAGAR
jgi:hypothetical protein